MKSIASWTSAGLFGAGLALALGAAQRTAPPKVIDRDTPRYEYAQLYLVDDTAVLECSRSVSRIQLPRTPIITDTVYRNDKALFVEHWNPTLYALNVFGADGWEVPPGSKLEPGEKLWVRRQR